MLTSTLRNEMREFMKQKKNRVGQIIKNKNGQEMTIITYRHCRDIDVVFEDGTVVNHQRMEDFIAGKIVNPNYKIAYDISMNEFIAQYYFQHIGFDKYECGTLQEYGLENYSLDLFNPTMKIGIEYDGNIHQHHTNRDETKDSLCAQNNIYLIRIRERLPQTKNAQCYHLATPTHFSSRYEDILKEIANHLHQKFDIDLIDINFKKDKQLILDTYAKNM